MRSFLSVLALLTSALARSNIVQAPLVLPSGHIEYDIPTVHESAIQARRIVQLAAHGDLVTTFPTTGYSTEDDANIDYLPTTLAGSPIGLLEYVADCESGSGNPTLLAIDIATPFRNYRAGSNISLAVRWWPAESNFYAAKSWWSWSKSEKQDIPTPRTPAALPRLSLHGRIEPIDARGFDYIKLAQCFIRKHPDSVYWQPQGGAHQSHYARFVVEEVYWFGGFGDRARIGWLPIDEWRGVTQREIDECRLPGEE